MSVDTYKSFAVVGVGRTVGLPLVKFLLERKASVVVLTRTSSTKDLPDGAKLVPVDYSDVDAVANVLREHAVDVLVSTLSGQSGLVSQYALSEAAKAAGVKLFVLSEFGIPTNDVDDGSVWGVKNRVAAHAKAVGLPTLRLFTGGFSEFIPWFASIETGKFLIVGKGETPISFTAVPDIAAYLAYILTTLSPTQLSDTILRIEGDRATLREIGALYEGKAPVEFVDTIPGGPQIKQDILRLLELGAGSTGWDHATRKDSPELAGSANKLYPEFKWKSVKEALGL